MTQEEKELLLKDLSARLPYRVICHIEIHHVFTGYVEKGDLPLNSISIKDSKCDFITCWGIDIDYVRPYLRPMSSMTEEEAKEYFSIQTGSIRSDMSAKIDFYIKHHFDFRLTSEGLSMIEASLAIEAPEGMYNLNKE
jgi:hypothetical protein